VERTDENHELAINAVEEVPELREAEIKFRKERGNSNHRAETRCVLNYSTAGKEHICT
jgi:hypothetical protein